MLPNTSLFPLTVDKTWDRYETMISSSDLIRCSKTVSWLSLIHKEGNERCFMYTIQYDCTTFTSRVNILNENTLPDIQITLYFIMSSIFYCLYYTLCLTLVLWFSIRTCKTELYLFQLAISDCYVYPSTWNIIGNNRETSYNCNPFIKAWFKQDSYNKLYISR